MRIADYDTSRGNDYPSGWAKITTPNQPPYPAIPVCQSPSDTLAGCFLAFFPVDNASCNAVCGKIKRYQNDQLQLLMRHLYTHWIIIM